MSTDESLQARGRAAWLTPLLVLLVALGVYAPTAATELAHDDARSASIAAWRVATTGQPWLGDFDVNDVGIPEYRAFVAVRPDGRKVITRSPGVVAAGVPAYVVAGGEPTAGDFSLVPGALTAALLAAGAVLLFFLALRSRMRERSALLATGVFALATPMWSVVSNSLWTHSVTVIGIAGMAWAASRERWWLVGLFGGVALWGRLHTVIIVAVLGLGVALARRRPRIALVVGSVSGACLALASVWSHWMYDTWFPSGGYGAGTYLDSAATGSTSGLTDAVVNQLGLWVSPDRGFLVWTPLVLLLLPALQRGWRDLPDWARWLPVGGILYTLVQGQLNHFTGGDGYYGYRLTTELLVCVAPAYALTAHRMGRVARHMVGPTIGLLVAAILLGALSEGFFVLRADAWTDNSLWLALRTVPFVTVWLVLMVIVGWLAGRVWQDRQFGRGEPVPATAGTG